jgi:uncharacterized protein DUF2786
MEKTMSRIHDKIAKLLAVANPENGATENEVEQAMKLATSLMLAHNISADEFKEKSQKVGLGHELEQDKKWHMIAAQAAGVLYGCRPLVWTGKFKFAGREDNVDAAEQTYKFISSQIEMLYKHHLPRGMSKKDRAVYRREFKDMCAMRVYQRASNIIHELKKSGIAATSETSASTALVVVKEIEVLESEVNTFFEQMGTRKARTRAVVSGRSQGGSDGYQAGNKVQLNRQVN